MRVYKTQTALDWTSTAEAGLFDSDDSEILFAISIEDLRGSARTGWVNSCFVALVLLSLNKSGLIKHQKHLYSSQRCNIMGNTTYFTIENDSDFEKKWQGNLTKPSGGVHQDLQPHACTGPVSGSRRRHVNRVEAQQSTDSSMHLHSSSDLCSECQILLKGVQSCPTPGINHRRSTHSAWLPSTPVYVRTPFSALVSDSFPDPTWFSSCTCLAPFDGATDESPI